MDRRKAAEWALIALCVVLWLAHIHTVTRSIAATLGATP